MSDDIFTMINEIDLAFYTMEAEASLEGQKCALYHHQQDPAGDAVDYLQQAFGFNGEARDMLRIPICQECMEALLGDDWILIYCVHCNQSRWVSRKWSQRAYDEGLKIKWIDGCPDCVSMA